MTDDFVDELTQLRAQRAAIEARRAERVERVALDDALETERRALADADALDRLESEHGPEGKVLGVVRTDLGMVIVKRAKPPLFKRFNEQIAKDNARPFELSEQLVMPCLLYPTREAFAAIVELQPFVMIRAANAITLLAGVRSEEVAGK